ncbi:hypothetical protein [Paracoccus lutimaris]|uniref:Uncharacterized protein n=1 Tax=Paracoccus lutimaris TaxID=1490030 RepID=A0A368YL86_9RHOB|nr:hypothetical protein [Paracoccus lutimaris]RCW81003.1 hypothetical protein DFP89_1167 [Paracoccus lutimaris]
MSDILLLVGAALCALSVLMAIASVLRTQPPRAAAIALVLGIVLMFGGATLAQEPFGIETLTGAGQRLIDGQISLGTDTVSAPPPAEAVAATEGGTAPAAPSQ